MHVHVIDAESDAVLIDQSIEVGETVSNTDAVGTYTGAATIHGPVYHGVSVTLGSKTTVHDWEVADLAVFVEWTDKSSSVQGKNTAGTVHRAERPLPGGGIGRFLVTVG